MKKTLKMLCIAVFAISVLFVSCSKGSEDTGKTTKKSSGYKVALVVESTVDDKGWCQAMYDGLVEAKSVLGDKMEFSVFEKMLAIDSGSIFRQCAAEGYDLILAHGAQYKNSILEVASDFPNVAFAYGTADTVEGNNVFTYMPESEETGYLSGLIAGYMTKSNIVGLVGPVDGGDAARYDRGYVMGVRDANPNAKILVAHTGSFSDNVKASEMATSQIRSGADFLTGSSQQAVGAMVATADAKKSWVAQDFAQLDTDAGRSCCYAASSYNYGAVIVDIINNYLDKGIKGGICIPLNFNNDGFVFKFNDALKSQIPSDVITAVEKALDGFKAKSGTLSNWRSIDIQKV